MKINKTLISIACIIALATMPTLSGATCTIKAAPNGGVCRSSCVKHQFDVLNGYPNGRKGYVVDHVCELKKGGLDNVKNMQYQTIADGKAKDRIEGTVNGKALYCTPQNSGPVRTVFNCK
jgi:hypothetical protein